MLSKLSDVELKEYYTLYKNGNQKTTRFERQKIDGADYKFLYHLVRLLNEIEQILLSGELDIEQNREQLKAIRRGVWKQEEIEEYFHIKEKELESVYLKSDLVYSPRYDEIRDLLFECLKLHGFKDESMNKEVAGNLIGELDSVIEKYRV